MDKMVERIKHLLALASDDGATEAEAALAAEKAQELMLKHGIDAAQVAMSANDAKAVGADAVRVECDVKDWAVVLASGVASSVGGRIVIHKQTRYLPGYITFICPAGTAQAASDLFGWLRVQLDLRSTTEMKDRAETWVHGRTWRRSWLEGAAYRLSGRLRERIREAEASSSAGALVCLRDAVRDKEREMYPRLGTYRGSNAGHDPSAFGKGQAHGGNMNIGNPQVGGSRKALNA
jgi:hypothetical protein